MKKIKIPILQKRFLIIWTLIHSFALFVNVAGIKGQYETKTYALGPETQEYTSYLFTGLTNESDFWPFTSYSNSVSFKDTVAVTPSGAGYNIISTQFRSAHYSYGLFHSYKWPEFIFYIGIALAIILVPQFWKDTSASPPSI